MKAEGDGSYALDSYRKELCNTKDIKPFPVANRFLERNPSDTRVLN